MSKHEKLAQEIGALVDEKNKAYGDSVSATETFLKALWPDGIPVKAYHNAALIIRVSDKLKRIATDEDALGENPWQDVAGYAIRAVAMKQDQKTAEQIPHRPLVNSFKPVAEESRASSWETAWKVLQDQKRIDELWATNTDANGAPVSEAPTYYECPCGYSSAPEPKPEYECFECGCGIIVSRGGP